MPKKEIYLVANVAQRIGERVVNFKVQTMDLDGDINVALNTLNRDLFSNYGDGGEYTDREIANESAPHEWEQGFWLWGNESTMTINGYLEINYDSYQVAEEIL